MRPCPSRTIAVGPSGVVATKAAPVAICSVRSAPFNVRFLTSYWCATSRPSLKRPETNDSRSSRATRHDAGSAASRSFAIVTSICQVKTRASASRAAKISRRRRCPPPGSGVRSRSLITSAVGAGVIARTNSSAFWPDTDKAARPSVSPPSASSRRRSMNVAMASAGAAGCATAGLPAPSTSASASRSRKAMGAPY